MSIYIPVIKYTDITEHYDKAYRNKIECINETINKMFITSTERLEHIRNELLERNTFSTGLFDIEIEEYTLQTPKAIVIMIMEAGSDEFPVIHGPYYTLKDAIEGLVQVMELEELDGVCSQCGNIEQFKCCEDCDVSKSELERIKESIKLDKTIRIRGMNCLITEIN